MVSTGNNCYRALSSNNSFSNSKARRTSSGCANHSNPQISPTTEPAQPSPTSEITPTTQPTEPSKPTITPSGKAISCATTDCFLPYFVKCSRLN